MNIYSVNQITRYIKDVFSYDQQLNNVMIRGEISNFKLHFSGHCYFTLKDNTAAIKCVMFKGKAQHLKFRPANGLKVVAQGYITVFERDGQYQLYVGSLFPEGAGELSLALEQLKTRLEEEGLFASELKKPLPLYAKVIGVVTSATGAVINDIVKVARRRNPRAQIVLYPVQVQGDGAAGQIARGIKFFNDVYPVDVLIIGRGGGSMEDLWAFNEEPVVRAIFDSTIPIISAVGHETDFTLADLASDRRAATPSQAAELAVCDVAFYRRQLEQQVMTLRRHTMAVLRNKRLNLAITEAGKILNKPQRLLDDRRSLVLRLGERLLTCKQRTLWDKRQKLQLLEDKLSLLNPLAVLKRGYSMTVYNERPLTSIGQVGVGDTVQIFMAEGVADASILALRKGNYPNGEKA